MAIVDELRDAALRMERGAFLQEPELLLSAAAGIDTLRAQVAELEKRVSLKSQEVVDVLNNAERYYADFRARIAELEREKGEWEIDKSRLNWLLVYAYSVHIVVNSNGTPYLRALNIADGRAAIDAAMKPTT